MQRSGELGNEQPARDPRKDRRAHQIESRRGNIDRAHEVMNAQAAMNEPLVLSELTQGIVAGTRGFIAPRLDHASYLQ